MKVFKICIRKSNIYLIWEILFLIVMSVVAFMLKNNHMEMIILIISLFSIFKIAKFSYFTIFSFILWFSFLQEYFASINPKLASGRLAWDTSVPVYHAELFICIMFFFILELLFFTTTNVLKNEKDLYSKKIDIAEKTAVVYLICALILVILAYPTLPNLSAELARDQGYLPSSLVVPLAVLLLATTYDNLKKNMLFKLLTLFTLFWIFFHGDRVIVLGYLVYGILRYMNDGTLDFRTLKSVIFNRRTLIVLIAIIVVLAIAIRVQFTRVGGEYSFSVEGLLHSIVRQGTAGDVVFAFNCSTNMWKIGSEMHGYTYLYYLSNILPSSNQDLYCAVILQHKYNTLGGGLFFVEPMMNGGIVLTFIHTLLFLIILVIVFSKKSKYASFLYIPFIILIFRFTWYASLASLVKMMLYYVPFVYFVAQKIKLR